MISLQDFLVRVEQIASEEPSYRHGGDGSDGTCDCIGLIIGAIRRAGGSWRGTHGSNYTARNEVVELKKINGDLKPGDIVFKASEPSEDNWQLPARYSSSPDQRDYYHVGVVLSADPLRIRHMTTPKPKLDTKLGKWKYHGWLKKIKDGDPEGGTAMEQITLSGGNVNSPINMRSGPGREYKIIGEIEQGSSADVVEDKGDWLKVTVGTRTGWVMKVFAHVIGSGFPSGETPAQIDGEDGTVTIPIADLEKVYDLLGDWLGLRG